MGMACVQQTAMQFVTISKSIKILLHVFTSLVPCCNVCYDFRVNK